MVCNKYLHKSFEEIGYLDCPFSNIQIQEYQPIEHEPFCIAEELDIDGKYCLHIVYTCLNCGQVHGDEFTKEYIDYRENIHRIYKKSIYDRKYHLQYSIDNLCYSSGIYIVTKI